MKTKNILMTLLLVTGAIAAKASGYPPELALVSQPVMVYNYNSITVYYDVENIGDYTYRGYVDIYLDPDNGYSYAEEYVRVAPGRIKRIAIDIPAYRPSPSRVYTIMPYYELDGVLYSFTTFEYFEPLTFYWNGPRTERWVVLRAPVCPRYYRRPGVYRYYYDGYRPVYGPAYGPGTPPPPMNPMHHTYGYHRDNGGYPASHPEWNNNPPASNSHEGASVRPKANGGSMSSGSYNSGNNNPPAPNNGASTRPKNNSGSNSGRVGNSSSSTRPSGTTNSGSSSGRVGNSSSSTRPSGTSSSSNSRVGNSSSSRSSGTSSSSNSRVGNSSSSRSSGSSSRGSSSSVRSSSSSSSNRSGSSNTRSSSSSSTRSSNSGRGSR